MGKWGKMNVDLSKIVRTSPKTRKIFKRKTTKWSFMRQQKLDKERGNLHSLGISSLNPKEPKLI